jgi:hypothetical protein
MNAGRRRVAEFSIAGFTGVDTLLPGFVED